jgi:hypothetical protein
MDLAQGLLPAWRMCHMGLINMEQFTGQSDGQENELTHVRLQTH